VAAAQQRQQRLGDRVLADHVHLELAPQRLGREELERPGHRDAGVVDQAGEAALADLATDQLGGCRDRLRVGHVQQRGHHPFAQLGAQRLGVLGPPHTGDHPVAVGGEPPHHGRPDPLRRAGDHHGRRGRLLSFHVTTPFDVRPDRSLRPYPNLVSFAETGSWKGADPRLSRVARYDDRSWVNHGGLTRG
jgi:hypothetical protein